MDARERLLTAGTRLFAEKGFAAVSIRELSQAANANSALISYHFGSKEGLYAAILTKQFAVVEEIIVSINARGLSPAERIAAYAEGVWKAHTQNPYIIRFIYSEFANSTSAVTVIQQKVRQVFGFLTQIIVDGIVCGQFRQDLNPAHAALAIAGMMNFYFLSRPLRASFLPSEQDHAAQFCKDTLQIYLNGVMRHDGK